MRFPDVSRLLCASLAVAALTLSASFTTPARAQTFGAESDFQMLVTGLGSDAVDSDIEPGDGPDIIFAKTNCKTPTFPNVCVKDGGTATLSFKLTCKKGTKPVSCGKVEWAAKANHPGIKTSFAPDPGNPTTETIAAAKTVKPGMYMQAIMYKCSAAPTCKGTGTGAIVVLK